MTFKKSKGADYFGTFLGTVGSSSRSESTPAAGDVTDETPLAARVRRVLATQGPESLGELAAQLGAPMLSLAEILKALEDAGIAVATGMPGSEMYALTEAGLRLSEVE